MSASTKQVEAVCGDCLEVLEDIPTDSVDAVITDPPYGTASLSKVAASQTFDHIWDRDLPLFYLEQSLRVLKPGGSFFCFTDTKRVETVWNAVEDAGLRPLQLFYWLKTNPPPQPRKNFASGVEVGVFARKPGKVNYWGGGGASVNYLQTPLAMGKDRTKHPTQKHVKVMEHLVRILCPMGGVVLDPFAGSGTTGVAGLLAGRRVFLIEQDPNYYNIMVERLKKWEKSDRVRQIDLFAEEE